MEEISSVRSERQKENFPSSIPISFFAYRFWEYRFGDIQFSIIEGYSPEENLSKIRELWELKEEKGSFLW